MESNRKLEEFYLDKHNILSAINAHITFLYGWIKNSGYRQFMGNNFNEVGIHRSLDLSPQFDQVPNVVNAEKILEDDKSYFIYGGPGIGKTTLLKSFVQKLLSYHSDDRPIPLVIMHQTLLKTSLTETLMDIFNVRAIEQGYQSDLKGLIKIFSENKFVLFIDGLDEMIATNQALLQTEISHLAAAFTTTKFIVTTRPYARFLNTGFQVAELLPLNVSQIKELIEANFINNDFLKAIERSNYYDYLQNPLMAIIMMDAYKKFGHLPTNSISLYKAITRDLLDDLDQKLTPQSEPNNLDVYGIAELLYFIAYRTIIDQKITFTSQDLSKYLNQAGPKYAFQLNNDYEDLINLITNSRFFSINEKNNFQFVHRSLVEYFAANYIVKLPNLNFKEALNSFPEVLALCVLLSSDQIYYFANVLSNLSLDSNTQRSLMDFVRKLLTEASKPEKEIFIKAFTELQPNFDNSTKLEFEILLRYYMSDL